MTRGFPFSLALVLLAACGSGKPAAVDPAVVTEAAASYRVGATIEPGTLTRGAKAGLAVTIEMLRPDVHVQKEFPLKVLLTSSPGLSLGAATLGHAEALDPASKGRAWKVELKPVSAGAQRVDVELRFAVCKETEPAWCVVRNEKVAVRVAVR
jgi:hypothetical protein